MNYQGRRGWLTRRAYSVKFVVVSVDWNEPRVTGPWCRGVNTNSGGGGGRGIYGGQNGGGSCGGKRRVKAKASLGVLGVKLAEHSPFRDDKRVCILLISAEAA